MAMNNISKTGKKLSLGRWFYDRLGLKHLNYHVPEHAQTLPYMLGGLSLGVFLVLFISGAYLAQFYNPNQLESNKSILFLISKVPFGNFTRSLHFWAANFAFLIILLHLIRAFITGSYKKPREFTWLTGLGLLAVTMAFILTGTMLSLSQEGVEALQHSSEIGLLLGKFGAWFTGAFSASVPLIGRIYVEHISILVILFILFIVAHFYLIKTHGISPKADKEAVVTDTYNKGKSYFSKHLIKLTGWFFISLALLAVISLLFPESLGNSGTIGIEVTKPLWMFLWLFGMENIFGIKSLVWGPPALFILLGIIPFIDRSPYLSPRRRPWIMVFGAAILLALIGLSVNAWRSPIEKSSSWLRIPTAYAHNMPTLSFSPSIIEAGKSITVSGDGLETGGEYKIYIKSTQAEILLGKTTVTEGADNFDADFEIPLDLPGGMYSVDAKSADNQKFDLFAPLQLSVQAPVKSELQNKLSYAEYLIPQKEIPWIVGFAAIFFIIGIILVLK